MANVGYTPGSGKTIATDTISTVEFQRVKVVMGSTGKWQEMQPVQTGGVTASTTDATIASSSCTLFGVMAYTTESAGRLQIQVRDSTSGSTGTFVAGFQLSSGVAAIRDRSEWFGPQGIRITSGLRIVLATTPTATVTLYYLPHNP